MRKLSAREIGRDCGRCGADEWYTTGPPVCAPCQRKKSARRKKEKPVRLFEWAKARATKSGQVFRITLDDVRALYGRRCPVFGTTWGRGMAAPTLDRLRPELGYVRGNVAVISMRANLIKSNARAKDVEKVAKWMRQLGL